MNVNSLITMEYENLSDWTIGQNKANSNPIKACPERTCPEQGRRSRMGQFHLPQRHALSYAEGGKTEVRCRFSEVRYLSSAFCFLSSVHGHELVNRMKRKFMVLNCSVPIRCSCKRSFFYMTFLLKELSHSVIVPPIFDLTEEL